jgi:hypothetical protein
MDANLHKKTKTKMKVSTLNDNVRGTVMCDKMQTYHHLTNKMKEQVIIAENHNNSMKQIPLQVVKDNNDIVIKKKSIKRSYYYISTNTD